MDLIRLVPTLCRLLRSSHLVLRQASVACLRQLSQREAREVCEHAMALINAQSIKETHSLEAMHFTDSGIKRSFTSVVEREEITCFWFFFCVARSSRNAIFRAGPRDGRNHPVQHPRHPELHHALHGLGEPDHLAQSPAGGADDRVFGESRATAAECGRRKAGRRRRRGRGRRRRRVHHWRRGGRKGHHPTQMANQGLRCKVPEKNH